MKIVAITFLSITIFLGYLIGSLFIPDLSSNENWRAVFWALHAILMSSLIAGPFLARFMRPNKNSRYISIGFHLLQWISYHLMGFYFILFFILIFKLVGQSFLNLSIGSFYWSWGALGVSLILTFLGFLVTTKDPEIFKIKISLEEQYSFLKNFKIIQLSDTHVSHTIRRDFVEKIVEQTNKLNPDIIVVTGDVIDGLVADLHEELLPFKKLKSKYGVYYVPGNHEYYWGIESWLHEFKKLNFTILLNESHTLKIDDHSLVIAGVHDLASHHINSNYRCDPALALSQTNELKSAYRILLAHQPKTIKLLKKNRPQLVLSGHTHAGQFFPASLLIFLFQPYVKGLHRIQEMWLYVNQGTGYWGPPNRLGTKSEITFIELI